MRISRVLIGFSLLPCLLTATTSSAQDVEWSLSESNVGIGTGSPLAKLHVQVDDDAYNLPFIVENTSNQIRFSGFRLQIAPGDFIDFNNSNGFFRINTDQSSGAEFEVRPNGNAWLSGVLTQNSDVNAKQDIVGVHRNEVLEKVVNLPISEWSYKDSPGARHMGPMAQDFHKLFALGDTDKGITSIDTSGVALAAIQGLYAQLQLRAEQVEQVEAENAALRAELKQHDERMLQLEMALSELMRDRSDKLEVVANSVN